MNLFTDLNLLRPKTKPSPEGLYIRSMARVQKKLGNLTQKKMQSLEKDLKAICDKYQYPYYEGAMIVLNIIDLKKQHYWKECLTQVFKTARNLGRESALTIDKKEVQKISKNYYL